ncbi:OmpA family protein [Cryptosporangium phraense]|uniref:OmpA family protein n=1 Tax=Cryptosporangium phraense TaxID=2593070 RepID=A0A545AEN6_9ACTN|nr:OmpA family protein [Cryptosporangium phraense]TQS39784.1 OmpA family protein [Cryptosporangium phraense]
MVAKLQIVLLACVASLLLPPPAATAAAAPTNGALDTTLGPIGLALPNQQLTLLGAGYRPAGTADALLDPRTTATPLGTGTADDRGNVTLQVTLPATLTPGPHVVALTGTTPTGDTLRRRLRVTTPDTELTSSAPGAQSVTLPIPSGGWVTLLDNQEEPVTFVSSRNQGTYSIDPSTGKVTFAPRGIFWGKVRPVHFQLEDAAGQRVRGTWAPTVTARPIPTVRAAKRTITDAAGATAQVGCTAGPIPVEKCTVTMNAVVGDEDVVLGTGTEQAQNPTPGTRVVDVALTPRGRKLAGRPGGIEAAITVRMWVPGASKAIGADATTTLIARTVAVPHPVHYAVGESGVPEGELAYLNALRSRMAGVTTVTCTGGTDDAGDADVNRRTAEERARSVCDYLTRGRTIRSVVQSVGEDQPVADNATEDGRARNRRVDVTFGYAELQTI